MFASTQDLEFVQGQSRDVPDRELVLNMGIRLEYKSELIILVHTTNKV